MSELRDTGSRYEMEDGGMISYADYRREGNRLFIDYVYAPPALRGSGASGRLMTAVATEARKKGLSITPICGFAAIWLQRNREFANLVR